ncbi:MAG: pyridoxal-phosphate dependent enzyme [Ferruginibacter sp.]
MLLLPQNLKFNKLEAPLLSDKQVELYVARLDEIHPVISGNKIFKLHYFLQEAMQSRHKTLLTFGGAYSNHLVAAAFAGNNCGIKTIGIVRGEAEKNMSHTLQQCLHYGMQLQYISRSDYKSTSDPDFINTLKLQYGDFTLVPEGGYHPRGAEGASLIIDLLKDKNATHICTATGTATTLAGLLLKARQSQQVIAVPVIKNMNDIEERLYYLTNRKKHINLQVFDSYHFGGYAKKTATLVNFMNDFYTQYSIPTDFVYTAKMMYAIIDKIKQDFFPPGSSIVCLHTGGLQGNQSLRPGMLRF